MKNFKSFPGLMLIITFFMISCSGNSKDKVKTGLDRVETIKTDLSGKNIGIITNHTAYNQNDKHIVDIIFDMENVEVTALFGPEHGIRGDEAAGGHIEDDSDPLKNVPIYSLYGATRKPTTEMLHNIDVLVFDIQDVGARYYTYISTMALAMEAAAENGKKFIVLDRPNPINGLQVEGNILEQDYATFVGMFPTPVRHGMTVGELALMINTEGWLADGVKVDLSVVKMEGWQRNMWYDQTGLKWRPPSPNIPDLQVAAVYPGTCLFEGTNISEGRGTYQPFLRIGAPWFNIHNLAEINTILNLEGLMLGPIEFTPKSISGMAPNPKYVDQKLAGVSLSVTDRENFKPYISGIALVKYLYDANPDKFEWRERHFDRLCGTDKIREFVSERRPIHEIEQWMNQEMEEFMKLRAKYLLY